MKAVLSDFLADFLSLTWLTGAIFEKELRVASRRRRNYILRFAYVSLLTIILVILWLGTVRYRGSAIYISSRMSIAGQSIVAFIIWFQFCAGQMVACVMLSNAISDEIYHKTLGLLMTTPINSIQIVMGKLLSRLLQLILLMAISLPLLAVVRIFGGIPWNYVISSLCITLSTVIFVGSLSLFFSIFCRKAYVVIIMTILTLGAVFALFPLLTVLLWNIMHWRIVPENELFTVLFLPNPYVTMFFNTLMFLEPRSMGGMPFFSWTLNCGILLAVSGIILLLSMSMVRKAALRQATGQLIIFSRKGRARKKEYGTSRDCLSLTSAIREVKGPPVLWKELRFPMLGRQRIISVFTLFVALGLLLFTYWLCYKGRILDDRETHMAYVAVFLGLGVLFTIILPATTITSEKESRAWPLLLTTTIEDREILCGKFIGSLRRLLLVWAILFAHLIIFVLAGIIHPIAVLQVGIVVTWVVVFLSCSGIYFSSRFKHTTTAIVMNFILAATIWIMVPILLVFITEIFGIRNNSPGFCMDVHPFYQAVNIMYATARNGSLLRYDSIAIGDMSAFEYTLFIVGCMVVYLLIGFLFFCRAKKRLRRNVF